MRDAHSLVFDEFQEMVRIDPTLIALMRSVFQEQPEVSHVCAGSGRHLTRQIFSDENDPFWRSAKQVELGVIHPQVLGAFIAEPFLREWVIARDL